MPDWIASTTEALQARIIAEADDRTLVLTAGGRLARQLRHAFRLDRMKKGQRGWLPPRILSLNAWIEETWRQSWPEEGPASYLKSLRLWEEAVSGSEVPEGLTADIALYRLLDETFQARIRNKVPPLKGENAEPLMAWRDEVFQRYEQLLVEQGLIHPAMLPIKVLQKIRSTVLPLWKRIILAGFEYPAPIELDLLTELTVQYGVISGSTRPDPGPVLSAVRLPNQEEEVNWICEQVLLAAQQTPLHRLGIVVPNLTLYAPLFAAAFRELLGPSVVEEAGNYNISIGQPLMDQPLVQAGLLPLRFFLEGEPRTLLLSLILSPYYKLWEPYRTSMAAADLLWRKQSIESGLHSLLECLGSHHFAGLSLLNPPGEGLETLIRTLLCPQQTAAQWVEALRYCWKVLGFPALSQPGEEGFYKHLQEALNQVADDLGNQPLDGPHFFAWLKTVISQTMVNVPGYEQAGIQVLGLIEARGLAFETLFLAGLSKGSLPQPVRTFPFLNSEERRWVQGATLQSQFDFARVALAHLQTAAPNMVLTRPEAEKGDPLPPSPFWPDHSRQEEGNYWKTPGKVWLRAAWLNQAIQGAHVFPLSHPPEDQPLRPSPLPPVLSVSDLETALACPFRFFIEKLLRVVPLEEIIIGISPQERGETLHKILALITKTGRQGNLSLKDPDAFALQIKHYAQEVLQPKSKAPHWQIEQRRLVGGEETLGGVLRVWLEDECKRWYEGWRWEKEEISFDHLFFPSWSFSLRGRIDRIDFNETSNDVLCWDYKTGSLPQLSEIRKDFLAPQLPVYLLAVKSQPRLLNKKGQSFRAGYIGLKSEGEYAFQEIFKEASEGKDCLEAWENAIGALGRLLTAGSFPADPKPKPKGSGQGACVYCPYPGLCAFWKKEE